MAVNEETHRRRMPSAARVRAGLGIAAVVLLGLVVACAGCTRVNAGHVGIKINMAGSQRGVQDIPLVTGWVFYNPLTEQVFEYPTYVQTAKWTHDTQEGSERNEEITFNSREGIQIAADISLSYQLDPLEVPHFYVKFRSDDLDTFTHGFLRNVARDQFNDVGGEYTVDEIMGPKKEALRKEVEGRINDFVRMIGVEIQQLGFIGSPRPPQSVIEAINAKVAATQAALRTENEVRQAQFEAQKSVATAEGESKAIIARAQGQAEANRLLAQSISPELIQWQQLQVLQSRWNGQVPMVQGSTPGLFLTLPAPGQPTQ